MGTKEEIQSPEKVEAFVIPIHQFWVNLKMWIGGYSPTCHLGGQEEFQTLKLELSL